MWLKSPDANNGEGAAIGCGKQSFNRLQTRLVLPSAFAISRREHQSGTKSSTGCSAGSQKNWRGRPLETSEIIVSLIADTTTNTGLSIRCQLDLKQYAKGL